MMIKTLMALAVFSLIACGSEAPAPEPEPSTVSPAPASVEPQSICTQAYTCDHSHWYGTLAACKTYCPHAGVCELDYRCVPGCVCP